MNSFGRFFRVSIYGESHGDGVGIVLDGVLPGIELSEEDFLGDIQRRKPGAKGTTTRIEEDKPEILSGVFKGVTTGAPINIYFKNRNTDSKNYESFKNHPRPGHADYAAGVKYSGHNDLRGGGNFSGRMTLPIVAAGTVAKKIIAHLNNGEFSFLTEIVQLGKTSLEDLEEEERALRVSEVITEASEKGDSIGGRVKCTVSGVPAGLGEPFFDSVESCISHIVFSIPGIKGIEFGTGFAGCGEYGSIFNDLFISETGETGSNNSGGINGGISNGNNLEFTVAVRPTPSIFKEQETFNFASAAIEKLVIHGRHDSAFILRVPVVIEAAAAIGLADLLYLQKR